MTIQSKGPVILKLLDQIESPKDLRRFSAEQLPIIAQEVRDLILEVISQKGGHFASNLGSVELATVLHYVFETPQDKIVWDVGHQSYPHKILTGRKDRFATIRQKDGLSGFTSRSESEYDHFGAGHASTSISAALGIAEGMRLRGEKGLGIAVIGDGSLTGGLAFEALNNAGHIPAKNLLVVFNDNEMAIDPNVGGMAKFVNKTVTHPSYNRMRKEIRSIVDSLSAHGLPQPGTLISKIRKSLKGFFTPGILFECFGFRYFGPINGHDTNELLETFRFIKEEGESGPYLVHCITTKGKGYERAEQLPLTYHGVNPFCVVNGIQSSTGPKKANYQDVFADTLIHLAEKDKAIVGITAAMPSGTGLNKFQKRFPNRTYDVGIAEAHAVCFAAGLATEGMKPVAAIYSTFLQRAYDQVIHDVALQNLPVIFAMDRAGVVGADGATHQGAFDLSYLRAVPNFVVMAPKDENELQHMIFTATEYGRGPIALRYPRGEVVGVEMDKELALIPIGKAELLPTDAHLDSIDVLLVGIGFSVQSAMHAQSILRERGISSVVINARFAKPVDGKLIFEWAQRAKRVVTIEENTTLGGFGSAVLEEMQKMGLTTPILNLGLPDLFVEHATQKEQRQQCGIDGKGIADQAQRWLRAEPAEKRPLDYTRVIVDTALNKLPV